MDPAFRTDYKVRQSRMGSQQLNGSDNKISNFNPTNDPFLRNYAKNATSTLNSIDLDNI